MTILLKNINFAQKSKFGQKYKFCSKIEILLKNINFAQKSKFSSKIEILLKNQNYLLLLICSKQGNTGALASVLSM